MSSESSEPSEEVERPRFRYPEEDTYAPIDPLSVLSLLGGIGALLATIFSPVFIGLGVIGIILGLSSLVRIYKSEGTLTGYWVATVGVGLSILFTSTYLSYSTSRDYRICSNARQNAEAWIEMVQDGKLLEAHQLTRHFFQRELPGTDLKKHYDSGKSMIPNLDELQVEGGVDLAGTPYNQMTDFFAHPVMTVLKERGHECDVRFVQILDRWRKGSSIDYVVLEYEVSYENEGQRKNDLFAITMMREKYPKDYGAHWAVDMIDKKKTMVDRTRKKT